MGNLKETPLVNYYEKYGGKIIDFAGWALPVQFEGIIEEHNAVRNDAGLFDVSHMGEIIVKGKESLKFLQHLLTNDISKLKENGVMYTLMCYSNAGIVDDLVVYKFAEDYFYLVVNAGNIEKDYSWIEENTKGFDVETENISENMAQLALQGPKAESILQKLVQVDLSEIKFFTFKRDVEVLGKKCLISRTGYTGEDGFEIYTEAENVAFLWDEILKAGKEDGLKPAGLGCRDTLRFEAALPLYGNELSEQITPLEAGLGFFVKLDKEEFIGKDILKKQKEEGLERKIVGFEMKQRGIPRHGYEVEADGKTIGFVTTGYSSPSVGKCIGLAMLDINYTELGTTINIVVRKKALKAEVVSKKFYTKNYKK